MGLSMSKRDWTIVIGAFLAVFLIDQISKSIALSTLGDYGKWYYSVLGFVIHKNHGAMLGAFSDLPPILRIVTLSTGGVFLVYIYAIIMKLLQHRLLRLRIGLSILLGGILGNVFDRIVSGAITDFIVFKVGGFVSPAFNLADALQWLGYIIVTWSLIKDGHLIWHDNEKRSSFWVDRTYQLKYCFMLVSFSLIFSVVLGVFSFTFLKVVLSESTQQGVQLDYNYLLPFVSIFAIISVAFSITLFLVGLRISHRSVGPVHAFRKYIHGLRQGRFRRFKLRSHDEFKYLQKDAKMLESDYQMLFEAKLEPKEFANKEPERESLSLSSIFRLIK